MGGRPTPIGTGMTADSQQENSCSSDGSAGAAVIPLLPTDYFLPQLGQERVCLPNETHVKLLDRPPLTTAFPCLNQSCDVPTEAELNEFVVGSWPLGHSTAAALPTSTLLSSAGDEVDSGRLSVATTTSTSSLSAASVRSSGSSGTSDYSNPSKNTFASPSDSKHHRTGVDRSWSSATTATLPSR